MTSREDRNIVDLSAMRLREATVADTVGGLSLIYQGAFAAVLACTVVMSAWQAQNYKRLREALTEMSRTDPLTGCLNRRGFEERAIAEISTASRKDRHGAILLL